VVRRARRLARGALAGRASLRALALVALPAAAALAEVASSVTLSAYGSLTRLEEQLAASAFLKGRLDLQPAARSSQEGRGQLQVDAWVADGLYLDVPRAWVRVRLPWFRLTAGKSRLSWGEGFVFNAGDVLFGSLDPLRGDISAESLRDQTAWLAALYVPLGPFSFLEAAVLPFGASGLGGGLRVALTGLAGLIAPRPFADLAGGAGLRGVFRAGGIKIEPGWYTTWEAGEHRPYLSLQGHLLLDWNLSAVLGIPLREPDWSEAGEWLALTGGLFHLARLGGSRSLSLRLEAALRPGAAWQEQPGASDPVYGLLLFPEAALALSDTLALQLRALVSPVDGSGLALLGASWSLYQGLKLFGYVAAMAGDSDDLYGWHQGGPALTLGAEFTY